MSDKQNLIDELTNIDKLEFAIGYKIATFLEQIKSQEAAARHGEAPLHAEATAGLKNASIEDRIEIFGRYVITLPPVIAEVLYENNIRLLRLLAPEYLNQ